MKPGQIRQKFFDFFAQHGHEIVASSSLIPAEDPTLLFANAGMNQFKDIFLGKEKRSYNRAVSIQKCVRAGGKHNDLDQVGFTNRHLTFFEMMGNFSFGDYFKKEAIPFAWEFFTKEIGIPGDRLSVSVYEQDDEAFDIWHKDVGLPKDRIVRLGMSENFWQMGDTGPCGPCTEIYYDWGSDIGCKKASCAPGCDCLRFTEIWNVVFMQFNLHEDGTRTELSKKGVDTGIGFERLCMVVANKDSIFDTEIFLPLHEETARISGKKYEGASTDIKAAFRVVADHVRSSSLIIADGGTPSNEGRGYVLRKIIRRAALFAQKLSDDRTLLPKVSATFIAQMSPIYPELKKNKDLILTLLQREVDQFAHNLVHGQAILQEYIEEKMKTGRRVIDGPEAFKLYDTYGFPPELTSVIANEQSFTVDFKGFEAEMEKQRTQSGKKMKVAQKDTLDVPAGLDTRFVGYEALETKGAIKYVAGEGDATWIITDETPFYVESGGQVNDRGWVSIHHVSFPVVDLKKVSTGENTQAIAVKLSLSDIKDPANITIRVGDEAHSVVDAQKRWDTVRNHTATHLLQAALLQVLGGQIKQAGSVVHEEYLRFDFTHHQPMTKDEIRQVEEIINNIIQEDIKTKIFETTLAQAKESGIISFFGEKYNPECVRVVEVPGFSAELCGGTHAPSTGIIGAFKITSETALSAGVRRIVAVTGPEAIKLFQTSFDTTKALAEHFKVKPQQVTEAVQRLQEQCMAAQQEAKQLRRQLWRAQLPTWQAQISSGTVPHLCIEVQDLGNEDLKQIAQELEKKTPGFFFLLSRSADAPTQVQFLGYLSASLTTSFDLKKFAEFLKGHGLRGGGSPTLIQGGGEAAKGFCETVKSAYLSHK